MIDNFHPELGFDCEARDADGTTIWSLNVERFTPIPVHISIVEKQA